MVEIIRQEPRIYEVPSETDEAKTYLVSVNLNHITCNCKSYIYRSHDGAGKATGYLCKHCKNVIERIKRGEA